MTASNSTTPASVDSAEATGSAGATTKPDTTAKTDAKAKQKYSDGRKAERRLGMILVAPAVILMLAVTAYPIIYARR